MFFGRDCRSGASAPRNRQDSCSSSLYQLAPEKNWIWMGSSFPSEAAQMASIGGSIRLSSQGLSCESGYLPCPSGFPVSCHNKSFDFLWRRDYSPMPLLNHSLLLYCLHVYDHGAHRLTLWWNFVANPTPGSRKKIL